MWFMKLQCGTTNSETFYQQRFQGYFDRRVCQSQAASMKPAEINKQFPTTVLDETKPPTSSCYVMEM